MAGYEDSEKRITESLRAKPSNLAFDKSKKYEIASSPRLSGTPRNDALMSFFRKLLKVEDNPPAPSEANGGPPFLV